jgi:pimeloyl-ACP methyl ester carboxylesterase
VIIREALGPREAPTVILVHGAGVAGWVWQQQKPVLSEYRTIIVDLPDHGLSCAQPFTTLEAVADELVELVPAAGAHLVGHSLGAKLVLEVLARCPTRVRSAVVSSALVRPSALIRLMNSHALNAMSLWLMRFTAIAQVQARQLQFPDQSMTDSFVSSFQDLRPENLDRPMSAFAARLFPPPGLDRVTCPVLLTIGANEVAGLHDSQRDLLGLLPTARSAVLEGAAHNAPWTHAAAYNHLLTTFLAETTPDV